jgi:hypothetical protein
MVWIIIYYHEIINNVFGQLWWNHEITNNIFEDYGEIMK